VGDEGSPSGLSRYSWRVHEVRPDDGGVRLLKYLSICLDFDWQPMKILLAPVSAAI
jgi:hypothetical protein